MLNNNEAQKSSNFKKIERKDSGEKLCHFLENEFETRCRRNPKYSMRAFAKSLSVDSSYLSKVLNMKRVLTKKALYSFAEKLNFPKELDFIKDSNSTNQVQSNFNELTLEQFKVIADWYHFAILEIIHLDNFLPEVKWISNSLNISYGETYAAVNRMKRLGLLSIDQNGKWVAKPNTTIKNKFSALALKTMQKQILEKAIEAMETTNLTDRDQSTITLCVDKTRLPEAKEKIKAFRRDLMQFLENGKNKDEVYQMSFSLFPVTRTQKGVLK